MSQSNPAKALNQVRTGHTCDRCNKRLKTGDLARAYATYYKGEGWVLRRVWCDLCGETTVGDGTVGADEVIVEAVFWDHRLVSVEIRDRNHP